MASFRSHQSGIQAVESRCSDFERVCGEIRRYRFLLSDATEEEAALIKQLLAGSERKLSLFVANDRD